MHRKHTDMRIEKQLLTFSGIFIGRKHVILRKQDKYAQQNAKFDIEQYSVEKHLHYLIIKFQQIGLYSGLY